MLCVLSTLRVANCVLGKLGYRTIMTEFMSTAQTLARGISDIGSGKLFRILSKGEAVRLPVVIWQLQRKETFDGMLSSR